MNGESDLMERALSLAELGEGHTRPNPCVGAVVVKDGRIVGSGWHAKAGGDHAEVAALKEAGDAARGATVHVTLEPCSTKGRVGACTDALIAAGVSRVVYAVEDPNPANRGRAAAALGKAGIKCELFGGSALISKRCKRLIAPFRKHVLTGLPYVVVKIAMSLDGKTCDAWSDAKWISCEESRKTTNLMREKADAIIVGAETLRRDNPSLLARRKPNDDLIRAVVSRSGRLDRSAQVFTDGRNKTLVFDDAKTAIEELGRMGCLKVLCEGGITLASSLMEQGLVDEWISVTAPVFIGKGRISEAMRGNTIHDDCIVSGGDAFLGAGFSDFAV